MPVVPAFSLTCDIRRPFGAVAVASANVPCNVVPALYGGEQVTSGPNNIDWDTWIDLPIGTDIRDGLSRSVGSNNFNYTDGDQVDVKNAAGSVAATYVVVYSHIRYWGKPYAYKRCYLLRHAVVWSQFH